jgi:hypothetical protein
MDNPPWTAALPSMLSGTGSHEHRFARVLSIHRESIIVVLRKSFCLRKRLWKRTSSSSLCDYGVLMLIIPKDNAITVGP